MFWSSTAKLMQCQWKWDTSAFKHQEIISHKSSVLLMRPPIPKYSPSTLLMFWESAVNYCMLKLKFWKSHYQHNRGGSRILNLFFVWTYSQPSSHCITSACLLQERTSFCVQNNMDSSRMAEWATSFVRLTQVSFMLPIWCQTLSASLGWDVETVQAAGSLDCHDPGSEECLFLWRGWKHEG